MIIIERIHLETSLLKANLNSLLAYIENSRHSFTGFAGIKSPGISLIEI